MGERKRGDDFKHIDEGSAETLAGQPMLLITHHHRRQKERQQEQYVVVSSPNVLDAGHKIIQELLRKAWAAEFNGLLGSLGAKDGRARLTARLQTQEPLMLWVDVEKEAISYPQLVGCLRARCGEAQNRVSTIAVVVDQMFSHRKRTDDPIGGDGQPGHGVGGDFCVLGLYLAPGDLAIGIRVEANGKIKVAQSNVPLSPRWCLAPQERDSCRSVCERRQWSAKRTVARRWQCAGKNIRSLETALQNCTLGRLTSNRRPAAHKIAAVLEAIGSFNLEAKPPRKYSPMVTYGTGGPQGLPPGPVSPQ